MHLKDESNPYDYCLGKTEKGISTDTRWTVILGLNSITYLVLSVSTLFLVITIQCWPAGCIGVFGHILGACSHIAAIATTASLRYSAEGKDCAEVDSQLGGDNDYGWTFKDHGKSIERLLISQGVLYLFYAYSIG